MINALGLLEVDGMVAAIDAADAMLKAANVRLLSHEVLDPGRLTLVVEGDLAACRAALDAGCAAAMRTGRVISRKEIGRPDDDTQWLVTGFNRQPKQPVKMLPSSWFQTVAGHRSPAVRRQISTLHQCHRSLPAAVPPDTPSDRQA